MKEMSQKLNDDAKKQENNSNEPLLDTETKQDYEEENDDPNKDQRM